MQHAYHGTRGVRHTFFGQHDLCMSRCYYYQLSIRRLGYFFHSFDYSCSAIDAEHLIFAVSPHRTSQLFSEVLGSVKRLPRSSSASDVTPMECAEGLRISFENSAMWRPITISRATTTLLHLTYKQTPKRHTGGAGPSLVCKITWRYKMVI